MTKQHPVWAQFRGLPYLTRPSLSLSSGRSQHSFLSPEMMLTPPRPERKVKKTLAKRQNNPKRGQYAALLGNEGLSLSRSRSRGSIGGMSDKE